MEVRLGPHPAQAKFNGNPLFDDEGRPIPLVTTQKSIWLDDRMVGYCGLTCGEPISFIVDRSVLNDAAKHEVLKKVVSLLGGTMEDLRKISQVATIPDDHETIIDFGS